MSSRGFAILGAGFDVGKLKLDPQFQSSPGQLLDPYADVPKTLARQWSQADSTFPANQGGIYPPDRIPLPDKPKPSLLNKGQVVVIITATAALLGLGATIYLLAKAKWAWAAANFFVLTPLGVGGVALASVAIASRHQKGSA